MTLADAPFVVLFCDNHGEEVEGGAVVEEDPHHVGTPLDIGVETL